MQKIMKIAQTKRQDSMKNMAIFTNSLMLGSVEDRVDCLANIGSVSVAALLAKTYGLTEKSEQLEEALNKDVSKLFTTYKFSTIYVQQHTFLFRI